LTASFSDSVSPWQPGKNQVRATSTSGIKSARLIGEDIHVIGKVLWSQRTDSGRTAEGGKVSHFSQIGSIQIQGRKPAAVTACSRQLAARQ
jgi:hypothetical protein